MAIKSGEVYSSDSPLPIPTTGGGLDVNGKDPGHQVQYGDGAHVSRGGKSAGGPSEERNGWHYTDDKTGNHKWP